ncbi:MAG TPA: thioredoxin domain-containing protein, partial [Polyangia bacterium]|nr:thioredoxin domain-containing protein [Polyangia bacterium]
MASQNVVEVTDANYKTDILGSKLPVLVDFWAVWC